MIEIDTDVYPTEMDIDFDYGTETSSVFSTTPYPLSTAPSTPRGSYSSFHSNVQETPCPVRNGSMPLPSSLAGNIGPEAPKKNGVMSFTIQPAPSQPPPVQQLSTAQGSMGQAAEPQPPVAPIAKDTPASAPVWVMNDPGQVFKTPSWPMTIAPMWTTIHVLQYLPAGAQVWDFTNPGAPAIAQASLSNGHEQVLDAQPVSSLGPVDHQPTGYIVHDPATIARASSIEESLLSLMDDLDRMIPPVAEQPSGPVAMSSSTTPPGSPPRGYDSMLASTSSTTPPGSPSTTPPGSPPRVAEVMPAPASYTPPGSPARGGGSMLASTTSTTPPGSPTRIYHSLLASTTSTTPPGSPSTTPPGSPSTTPPGSPSTTPPGSPPRIDHSMQAPKTCSLQPSAPGPIPQRQRTLGRSQPFR